TPPNPSSSSSARFEFTSSSNGYRFECSRDGATFSVCASPAFLAGLTVGSHTFRVRSIDVYGDVETTPASYAWTVSAAAPPPNDAFASAQGLSGEAGSINADTTTAT